MQSTEAHYINTDLELCSNAPLAHLHRELEQNCSILYYETVDSRTWLTAEIGCGEVIVGSPDYKPETHLCKFLSTIARLSEAAKAELGTCHERVFNLGFEGGDSGRAHYELSSGVVQAIAEANFSMLLTLYPVGSYSSDSSIGSCKLAAT